MCLVEIYHVVLLCVLIRQVFIDFDACEGYKKNRETMMGNGTVVYYNMKFETKKTFSLLLGTFMRA